ncbi:MAG TPA: single-stranded DNA-binding protein [Actinomycetota bacterium]|nr:single-stranded DNA-binding protein [Actinomycetota bacterium]
MAGIQNSVTIVGNVTDDPELRFTPSGLPVANFTVAVNSRVKKGDQWEDRNDGFFRCSCWRDMAENVAESLQKGTRVIVSGRLQEQKWEDNDGGKRSRIEIQVDEVGPTLRWATATVTKSQRSSGGGGQGGQGGGSWGAPPQGAGGGWGSPAAPAQGGQQPAESGSQQGGSSWGAPAPVGGPEEEGGF